VYLERALGAVNLIVFFPFIHDGVHSTATAGGAASISFLHPARPARLE
jgi:hypothetical protein